MRIKWLIFLMTMIVGSLILSSCATTSKTQTGDQTGQPSTGVVGNVPKVLEFSADW